MDSKNLFLENTNQKTYFSKDILSGWVIHIFIHILKENI